MKKSNFQDWLVDNDACSEAVKWVGDRAEAQAWKQCPQPAWLIWYLGRRLRTPGYPDINQIALLACWCARRALKYVPAGEDRPRLAIEAAEKCAKNPTPENRAAAWAAGAALAAAGAAAEPAAGAAAEPAAGDAAEAAWAAARAAGDAERRVMADHIRKTIKLKFEKEEKHEKE